MLGTDNQSEEQGMQVLVRNVMVTMPKTLGPLATVDQIRLVFEDDHVHMALIVDKDRRLLTTIDRADIPPAVDGATQASIRGTLVGRTIDPDRLLSSATADLQASGRRRLAVTDEQNHLLGLLCLKRSGSGYCSDEGVRTRAEERSEALSRSTAST
jgi:predicted transcriptional regulator